jgi:hypothetical protein
MTRPWMTRLSDSWVDHPAWDYLIVALAVGGAAVINPTNLLLAEQHGDWYQTLAGVNGALVGVAGVAVTLVFTVPPNDRLQLVLKKVGPNFGRLVMSCIGGLVLTTAGFAFMYLLETASHRARVAATTVLVAFALLRAARLWRLFVSVILLLSTPSPAAEAPSESGTPWERPVVGPDDYAVPRRRPRRTPAKKK